MFINKYICLCNLKQGRMYTKKCKIWLTKCRDSRNETTSHSAGNADCFKGYNFLRLTVPFPNYLFLPPHCYFSRPVCNKPTNRYGLRRRELFVLPFGSGATLLSTSIQFAIICLQHQNVFGTKCNSTVTLHLIYCKHCVGDKRAVQWT
jgi:hypothetical protein